MRIYSSAKASRNRTSSIPLSSRIWQIARNEMEPAHSAGQNYNLIQMEDEQWLISAMLNTI
jgi:hypothetical protein